MIPCFYRSIESPIPSSGRNKKLVDVRIPGRSNKTQNLIENKIEHFPQTLKGITETPNNPF